MTLPLAFRPLTLVLGLAAATSPAWAQTSPWGIGVSEQVNHDSNVLRTPDASASADTYSATGLRFALDQAVGRDRLHGSLSADETRFRRLSYLNNTSYQGDLGLDWTAAGLWQGELGAQASKQLYLYNLNAGTTAQERTLATQQHLFGRARVGVITDWTFEAAVEGFRQRYSSAQYANQDQQRVLLSGGLRYGVSPNLNFRTSYRYTEGRYPNLGTGDNFTRNELQFSTFWQASGASTVDASASISHENHTLQTSRNSTYWAGSARWQWQPTGKLLLSSRVARDSDTGTTDISTISADARLRTIWEFTSTWNVSGKVSVNAQVRRIQRNLDDTFAQVPGIPFQASDRTDSVSLGVTWQPVRAIDLGCQAAREQRHADDPGIGLTYAYHSTAYNCSAQFWWR